MFGHFLHCPAASSFLESVVPLKIHPRLNISRNYSASFDGIWPQRQSFSAKIGPWEILLGSQSWPHTSNFQTSCQSGLVAAAPVCLPLILAAADTHWAKETCQESQRSQKSHTLTSTAPRGCATWCILVLQGSCCICIISMQFSTTVGFRNMQILSRGYSSTSPSQPFYFL